VLNRGNLRARVFRRSSDYLGFMCGLADASERTTVRLLAFCLMPNHFHLVLWPFCGAEVPTYMQIVMNAHIRDLQRRHGTTGTGHIYQGRYKNVPIASERHFFNVCRYVEANAFAAGLVDRAEQWEWSSLTREGPAEDVNLLSPWPVGRPRDWLDQVNRPQSEKIWRELRKCRQGTWLAPLP
jgi:putative transposase